jgi:hypothetical protein
MCGLTFNASAQNKEPALSAAQYRPLAKGEPMPYAGVAVGLATYRAEGFKFKLQKRLIDSLSAELNGKKIEIAGLRTQLAKKEEQYGMQADLTQSSQQAAKVINSSLQVTQQQYKKTTLRFYEKPVFLFSAGFIVGSFTTWKVGTAIHLFK